MTPRLKTFARYSALTVLLAAASLILQSQMPTGGISGGGGGGGSPDPCSQSIGAIPSGLHCTTVNLAQANILALCDPAAFTGCTPFTVLAAQGANTVIFPVSLRWALHFVSTPYASSQGGPYLWWQNNTNAFGFILLGPNYFHDTELGFAALGSTPLSNAAFYTSGLSANFVQGVNPVGYTNQPITIQAVGGDTLNRGPVTGASITTPGTGYVVGDQIHPTDPANYEDSLFTVLSVNGSGGVTGLTISTSGTKTAGGSNSPVNVGNVISATVTAGQAGTGYANGDTGTIDADTCGDGTATYTVLTSSGGAVTTVSATGGTGYSPSTGCLTTATSGGGSGLQLNTVGGGGSGLVVNLTVTAGDGTLTITLWYTVATP